MKKRLIQLALLLGLMALTCVAAQAAEAESANGFRDVSKETNYETDITLTPVNESGATVALDDEGRYPGAVKMKVTYNKATQGSEYLLCVLMDSGAENVVPSVDNMAYIDQKQADSAAVEFTAYPKKSDSGDTITSYSVYLSSNADGASGIASFTKVGAFKLYDASGPDVLLGDLNQDGNITIDDAYTALLISVNLVDNPTDAQIAAGDVDKNGSVTIDDAYNILLYSVNLIDSFDNLAR